MEIREEPRSRLDAYARIPIAFEVERVLELSIEAAGLTGIAFAERPLRAGFRKDYDAIPGNRPTDWATRFDLSNWGLLSARQQAAEPDEWLGAAALAFDTPGVHMLAARADLAVLWDLRVTPASRGQGVGTALFRAAEQWARARGCRQLKVETQNINVPACRFYASRGCTLGSIDRFAYPDLPQEIQLVWYKDLVASYPSEPES